MFDRIPGAEPIDTYLEKAFARGRFASARVKRIKDPTIKLKAKERDRIRGINETLTKSLQKLHGAYPSFDQLGEFTVKVFSLSMDPGRVKKALGGLQGCIQNIRSITNEHIVRIGKAKKHPEIKKARDGYVGRISSVLRQSERHLKVLNEARAVFRSLPEVDESLFTVAIAGFPNVGKSTLLRKLTTATPEVKAYAFTTKGLNVGYFTYKYNRIQCIDTPGTLARSRMNAIEKKADVALTYLADVIVYVFDPTESYSMAKQMKLYEQVLELDKDVLVYVSKEDLVSNWSEVVSVDGVASPDEIRKLITEKFKEWI